MSMIANFLRVSQDELDAFLNDSSLLEDRIYNEESDESNLLDIDKSWDGIIYLLTGSGLQNVDLSDDSGLHKIIFSGQLIDPEQDLGYGPAHYLTPEEVKNVSKSLSGISKENLYSKYNPSDMAAQEVYPIIWEEEGDEAFDYLYSYFEDLKEFYEQAAKENQAVISILN